MVIGIPKESLTGETRIAIFPADIKQLSSDNVTFIIEAKAGNGSFISDEDYSSSGADIVSNVYSGADHAWDRKYSPRWEYNEEVDKDSHKRTIEFFKKYIK